LTIIYQKYRWGWFAFNAGCAYGVTGGKWDYAVRAGIGTALATYGAGACSLIYSMIKNKGRVDVYEVISGILASISKFITTSNFNNAKQSHFNLFSHDQFMLLFDANVHLCLVWSIHCICVNNVDPSYG